MRDPNLWVQFARDYGGMVVGFIPIVGSLYDAVSLILDRDLIGGRPLTNFDQKVMAVGLAFIQLVGLCGRGVGRGGVDFSDNRYDNTSGTGLDSVRPDRSGSLGTDRVDKEMIAVVDNADVERLWSSYSRYRLWTKRLP